MNNHDVDMRPPVEDFSKRYRAYSTAIFEARQGRGGLTEGRSHVMHGGKILMPQEALIQLTHMDMESPFMFEIRNSSPQKRHLFTHCGVLEFTADPGKVHLPQWMMTRLELNDSDHIHLTGARLPKGKFAKVQAQSTLFQELSDPKSVLETALRNFSCLTKGDIIEIYHNMMIFDLLIMELEPHDARGVSIFETDLEVDFAPPVGYKEPAPVPRALQATMASKMCIDACATQFVNACSGTNSRSRAAASGGVGSWEAFKGAGWTLDGRNVKGKGVSQNKIEDVDPSSKIFRTDVQRIVTADTQVGARQVPARLDLPFGTLFFGYNKQPNFSAPVEGQEATAFHAPVSQSGRPPPLLPPPANQAQTDSFSQSTEAAFPGKGNSLT